MINIHITSQFKHFYPLLLLSDSIVPYFLLYMTLIIGSLISLYSKFGNLKNNLLKYQKLKELSRKISMQKNNIPSIYACTLLLRSSWSVLSVHLLTTLLLFFLPCHQCRVFISSSPEWAVFFLRINMFCCRSLNKSIEFLRVEDWLDYFLLERVDEGTKLD